MKKRLLNIVCFYGEAGCRYGGGGICFVFSQGVACGETRNREVGGAAFVRLHEILVPCVVPGTWVRRLLEGQVSLQFLMEPLEIGNLHHFGRMVTHRCL